jgi:internalin A
MTRDELREYLLQNQEVTELNLSNRGLTELPPEIGRLANLQRLYLGNNQLTALPPEIGRLANLQALSLWGNLLTALPPEIGKLANLQILDLDGNQLKGLPPEIGHLANLQRLFFQSNQLTTLPPEIGHLKDLKTLDLRGNPLPIPPEISANFYKPQAIITWYLANVLSREAKRPLNEAKLILVGEAAVGKTSLTKRLLGEPFVEAEDTTRGIEIRRWQVQAGDREVKLNLWDFGGQEIMHATHQFFLTRRSLYLLVLNSRESEVQNRLEYWLKLIETYGQGAPVIVVCNKCDQGAMGLNWRGLQLKYPFIGHFIKEVSCKTGKGIEELRQAIAREIGELRVAGDQLADPWFQVKDRLAALAAAATGKMDYLSFKEYKQICREAGITKTAFQKTLIGYLHDLGIALHFTEHAEGAKFSPREDFVLNPEWITNGVYQIINSNRLFQNKGVLRLGDLGEILDRKRYPAAKDDFFLKIMRVFKLLVDFPGGPKKTTAEEKQFLIPELLGKEEPYTGDWEGSLALQYHYEVMPPGLISRFIVLMHQHIHKHTYWRTGVVLATPDGRNRALVRADLEDNTVAMFIKGEKANRRRFLTSLRDGFEVMHQDYPGLKIAAKVPVPGHPGVLVDYRRLEKLEERGYKTDFIDEIDAEIDVQQLLHGVESKQEQIDRLRKEMENLAAGLAELEMRVTRKKSARLMQSVNESFKEMMGDLEKQDPRAVRQRLAKIKDWLVKDLPGDVATHAAAEGVVKIIKYLVFLA